MSTNFLADVAGGVVAAIKADDDLATLQVLSADTDELRETASFFVGVEINRELVAGSRVFILDGQAILRINRSAYTADEAGQIKQNVLAAMLKDGGSSMHPGRALVMTEPPSIDAGEITDKGYINQRAVLERRAV